MEATWTDNTDKTACLCCGQTVLRPMEGGPGVWEHQLKWLWALGYTRESLLTTHREQLDYQLPGMAAWLQGQ